VINAEFSASLLQSSESHNPSEINANFLPKKHFYIISVENRCAA